MEQEQASQKPKHILLITWQESWRNIVERGLRRAGYDVTAVGDLQTGIERLTRQGPVDAVVCDFPGRQAAVGPVVATPDMAVYLHVAGQAAGTPLIYTTTNEPSVISALKREEHHFSGPGLVRPEIVDTIKGVAVVDAVKRVLAPTGP